MTDIGFNLVMALMVGMFLWNQLPEERIGSTAKALARAYSALVFVVCLLSIFGVRPHVQAPRWVDWLVTAVIVLLWLALIFFYVRNDARRLREKKAAQQPQ
jgi:cobalamin synthase